MHSMKASRARAILSLLKLERNQVRHEINLLAGTSYTPADAYRWFTDGQRNPSVSVTVYLRMKILEKWRARALERKYGSLSSRRGQIMEVVCRVMNGPHEDVAKRLERRVRLSIDEVDAKRRAGTANDSVRSTSGHAQSKAQNAVHTVPQIPIAEREQATLDQIERRA